MQPGGPWGVAHSLPGVQEAPGAQLPWGQSFLHWYTPPGPHSQTFTQPSGVPALQGKPTQGAPGAH